MARKKKQPKKKQQSTTTMSSEPETEIAPTPQESSTPVHVESGENGGNVEAESSLEPEKVEPDAESPKDQEETQEESANSSDENHHPKKNSSSNTKKNRTSLISLPRTVIEGDDDYDDDVEDPWVTSDSDLSDPQRKICVVTTAALPWRTGTAVNPLLRALYLTRERPKHYVSLVIPWCPDEKDRKLTLGKEHEFANAEEQEEWIRAFCRDRAGCPEEEDNLKIIFYEATYNEGFGSIFPSVDICSLIPEEDADIAILEEPEHLNWLRVPEPYNDNDSSDGKGKKGSKGSRYGRKVTAKEKAELGWRFKFRHVVGIIHTNYKAYAEQYGMAAKVITAPALCALNALVVRAYCHRVILLSGTLPSLTPYKEVTCNVHGVRHEFLECPSKEVQGENGNNNDHEEDEKYAPVYMIGKLIWAKGFDKILDLQDMYREKHNDYFAIDIYGSGGDEKPIKRAFYGRIPQIQRHNSPKSEESNPPSPSETAEVFTWETSIRSHLVEAAPFTDTEKHECFDDVDRIIRRRSSLRELDLGKSNLPSTQQPPTSDGNEDKEPNRGSLADDQSGGVHPISVLGDLSHHAFDTAKATSGAAVAAAKNVVNAGLNVTFTKDIGSPKRGSSDKGSKPRKPQLIFEPPQSIFEFRRNPIPARFLGTKDHVMIRDIPEHKIFLNMSITEVLCTTSAEALAMGKFVILPKHPSNTFFAQFPNCLLYDSLEDCQEKLEWALAHEPKPLSEESALKLSWEGANERLFESSAVTKDEYEEWVETGRIKSDDDAARFHVETGMRGQLIGKFFTGDKTKEDSSK